MRGETYETPAGTSLANPDIPIGAMDAGQR